LLASLITALVSGETLLAVRRARRAAVVYGIATVLGLLGVIFLVVAGYVAAAERLGAITAALAFGGGFLVLAVLMLLVHRVGASFDRRRTRRRRKTEITQVAIATGLAVLPALLRGRAGTATLLAPAIAAVAYAIYRENSPKKPEDEA